MQPSNGCELALRPYQPSKDSKWTSFESLPLDFKFDSNNLSTLTTAQLVVLRWADGIHYSTELAYAVEEEFYRRFVHHLLAQIDSGPEQAFDSLGAITRSGRTHQE